MVHRIKGKVYTCTVYTTWSQCKQGIKPYVKPGNKNQMLGMHKGYEKNVKECISDYRPPLSSNHSDCVWPLTLPRGVTIVFGISSWRSSMENLRKESVSIPALEGLPNQEEKHTRSEDDSDQCACVPVLSQLKSTCLLLMRQGAELRHSKGVLPHPKKTW